MVGERDGRIILRSSTVVNPQPPVVRSAPMSRGARRALAGPTAANSRVGLTARPFGSDVVVTHFRLVHSAARPWT